MLNVVWAVLLVGSLAVSVFTGRVEEATSAVMSGANDAVQLSLSLMGVICLWSGLMKIAEEGGLVKIFSRLLRPVIRFLFPRLDPKGRAANAMTMNIVANFLGMCNVATPLGIQAMKELHTLRGGDDASDEMCTFALLNTASVQLIPSTMIAMRVAAGSSAPFEVIPLIWIASFSGVAVALISGRLMRSRGA